MTFEELLNMLRGITADTTIEEARRINAEVIESFENEITNNNNTISILRSDLNDRDNAIKDLSAEVDRLKEENGRLYRERLFKDVENNDNIDIDIKDEIKKLEKEIEF